MDNITIALPAGLVARAHGHELPLNADTPTATMVYLLLNGFSQSITDAGTSGAAQARRDAITEANKARGKGNEMSKAQESAHLDSDAVKGIVQAALVDAQLKRLKALNDGTMIYASRGPNGPRRTAQEQYFWDQAEAAITASVKRAKERGEAKVLPKGEAYASLVEAVIAKNRKEYEKSWAKLQSAGDDVLDGLI